MAIHRAGGISIEFPTLEIRPTSSNWLKKIPLLASVDQALFISPNAVHYFFKALHAAKYLWPTRIEVTAIGQGSAQALAYYGVTTHHIPSVSDSEHLLSLESLQRISHQTIFLIKGEGGRDVIEKTLSSRQANLEIINVYHRTLPEKDEKYSNSLWREDAVDIILFTSQEAMQNLFVLFGKQAHAWIITKPCVVISQRLAEIATTLGMQTVIISNYDALLTTLEGLKK